jgi:hypothetical protein
LASLEEKLVPLIGLDSLFQKTQTIAHKKRTFQPGDEFEDTAFMSRFEIAIFYGRLLSLRSSLLCEKDTNQRLSDIELIQASEHFFFFYPK